MAGKQAFLILSLLFIANIFAWSIVYDLNQPRVFEVVFFDVGQGDSILIKSDTGHHILIDGGEDDLIIDKLNREIPFYKREIDLVVLTHAHADHLGGLMHVLKNYKVNNILWNGVVGESALAHRWHDKIEEEGHEVKIARAGQRIKSDNFFMDVLYPFEKINNKTFEDLNLSSVILRIVHEDYSFLLMGDAYKSTEEKLLRMAEFCSDNAAGLICRNMVLDSKVLKVGHHGSRTSTSDNFVKEVSPSIAVISCGKNNRYGHPHKEVLEVLEKYDIKIARTDLKKDIRIQVAD